MIKLIDSIFFIKNIEEMIIPVRCFTCNKVLGNKWEEYQKLVKEGTDPQIIFNKLGIKRYCCKRILTTSYEFTCCH